MHIAEFFFACVDRHRMSQEQFAIQARELDDMNKRNQQLYDQWTRIDIECSRATEDLQVANGRIEQYRNECANLRAEKKIWEVSVFIDVFLICSNSSLECSSAPCRGEQDTSHGALAPF